MAPLATCRFVFVVALTFAGCRGTELPVHPDAGDERRPLPDAAVVTFKWDATPAPVTVDAAPACSIALGLSSAAPPSPPPSDPSPPSPPIVRPPLPTGNPALLTPEQLAGRLTRWLWGAEPQPDLVARIAACPPRSAYQVRDLARQMLKDPRARHVIEDFFRWWLSLDRLDKLRLQYPMLGADLVDAIAHEPERLASHVVFEGDGRFPTLLTANFTFVNEPLARHYGIPGVTGAGVTKVSLDGQPRLGLLTQAALLLQGASGDQTSPSQRGLFVRNRILCEEVPPHPLVVEIEPRPAGITARAWLDGMMQPICRPCHELMDPMGLSFETYDRFARHQEIDQGMAIDTAGKTMVGYDLDLAFSDPIDLARKLAASRVGDRCFAAKWVEYAAGRPLRSDEWRGTDEMAARFLGNDSNISWLIAEVTTTALFLNP